MEDAPAEAQPEDIPESAPETDKVESQPSEDHTEPAESMTVSDGRRRGRRRVMKKKTVKDEEGYLGISFSLHCSGTVKLTCFQSRERRRHGSHFQKTSLRPRSPRYRRQPLLRQRARKVLQRLARAVSCLSSRRPKSVVLGLLCSHILANQSCAQQA